MSLVPVEVVANVYRRYVKSVNRIPNMTIRLLLLHQIRSGFRKNAHVTNHNAQKELLVQAQKDLQILEDDRLSRTLYITRFGHVSCIDWELRRTEYHIEPRARTTVVMFLVIVYSIAVYAWFNTSRIDKSHPDIAKLVDQMAIRLEGGDENEIRERTRKSVLRNIDTIDKRLDLEHRILSTFSNVPSGAVPTLTNPEGYRRAQR